MKKKYLISKLASLSPFNSVRCGIYKFAGYKIGKNVKIARTARIFAKDIEIGNNSKISDGVFIGNLKKLKIGEFTDVSSNVIFDGDHICEVGDNCFIGNNYHINVRDKVTIEDNVALGGSGGQIWTHSTWPEEIDGHKINKIAHVHIGKNVWIGTKSVIHPGVRIGQNSIIGSNSLVTKEIPNETLAFGVPAIPIKKINEIKKLMSLAERKNVLSDIVKRFIDIHNEYEMEIKNDKIILSGNGEKALLSLKTLSEKDIANLDNKTAYFDIERKVCSNKNLKLETKFRRFANYYSARFKSE